MKNENAAILVIAPGRSISATARRIVAQKGLEVGVETANDDLALSVLKRHPDARVVVSRGGTSKSLRSAPGVTVVDICASFADIAQAVQKLIDRGCRRISVVSQDNLIDPGVVELRVGDAWISTHPCANSEEIVEAVRRCAREGSDGIAGCYVATGEARRLGIPSEFIDENEASLAKYIDEAVRIEASTRRRDLQIDYLNSVINHIGEGVAIFGEDRQPVFANDTARRLLEGVEQGDWYRMLAGRLDQADGYSHPLAIGARRTLVRCIRLGARGATGTVVLIEEIEDAGAKAPREGSAGMGGNGGGEGGARGRGLYAKATFDDILYQSRKMAAAVELARQYAFSDSTVMIFGESGAGKEGFAQSIHNASSRRRGPFVSMNCASLPEGLVASELFGYARGAFTGARQNGKKGLFEMAQDGTIFLDEVSELPLDVQSQMLRVIQEREVMRIGGDSVVPLNIRIICASNKPIIELCRQGRFRYDLYYRLNVLRLSIPPLRERPDDIAFLFRRFFARYCAVPEYSIVLSDGVRALLSGYSWPGNVRELRNIAEALSFYGPSISTENLRGLLSQDLGSEQGEAMQDLRIREGASMKEVEAAYLSRLAERHGIKEICEITGLSRTTLWRRLREAGIASPGQ
ncbi:MAG: sigma 54-interacting transcriptional regulator [Succinivibrio sp.]